jgi:hypothetical protein
MKILLFLNRGLSVCTALTAMLFLQGCASVPCSVSKPAGVEKDLAFVYLHGIGGAKEDPEFCDNMNDFLEKVNYDCEVVNYQWDSVDIDFMQAGASWLKSERRADAEAKKLKERIIYRFEKERTPYVLIGYSIGARVVLRALEASNGDLEMLRGVYFLGAAMAKDVTIDKNCLPEGMKIVNYHSPKRDRVHQIAFNFMKEKAAGGRVGFDDEAVFDNYRVSCSHFHKSMPISIDYSQLAHAIGYLVFLEERIFVPGEADFNLDLPVGEGEWWWNTILRTDYVHDGERCTLEIEQLNMNRNYFRAVVVHPEGGRRRIARGSNIHAILDETDALPDGYWREGDARFR